MALSPMELMDLQARTLFVQDEDGRLAGVNERSGGPAPLVFIGKTAEGTLVRVSAGAAPGTGEAVAALVAAAAPWRLGVPDEGLARALVELAGGESGGASLFAGPAFAFPPALFPPMGVVQLYPGHAHLLHPALATLGPELRYRRPAFAVMRDGCAVSVCYSARISAGGAEAGVETAPEFRGKGCAALAVDAWASEVREKGRTPLYSTAWTNTASLAVVRKLDLVCFGEDLHVTLAPGHS
ncbi:MAG: GNAT family N-acetyltransferase [Dehalococcoidia bacterium]